MFLNFAVCSNQLLADLPPITFDSAEWIPYQNVGTNPATGWNLVSGAARVSAEGQGLAGTKALQIPITSQQESRLSRAVSWNVNDKTAFIDFHIKPPADPTGSLANFYANGTQIAFQVPNASSPAKTGNVWVYHGSDGGASGQTTPRQWLKTAATYDVAVNRTSADQYTRVTLRHDYARNLWDLFVNGKLVAANLAYESRGTNLQTLEFFGSNIGETLIDDISAQTANMLFPDADKDGISDAWELANGSNPNLYDRDAIKPGTQNSFLDAYMASLWPSGGSNANSILPASTGIPPLSINTEAPHRAVGALKGSLSVGGDGSANYSVPIDIPKGSGGMEPSLSLNYSSGGGNGIMGVGWNLSGLQRITRGATSTAKDGFYDPMDFDANDRFFLDGERLVCVAGIYGAHGSEYRTEMDSYARITAVGSGPTSWKVETKAGLIMTLGGTFDSKISVAGGTLSWGVNQVKDTVGNYYAVEYARDSPTADFDFINYRVAAIRYTGNEAASLAPYCSIEFAYQPRNDVSRSYSTHAGYLVNTRLAKIFVKTGTYINHSYQFTYTNSFQTGRSFLATATKVIQDNSSLAVPASRFSYDGISEYEALWKNPGESNLPVYGSMDSSNRVNSMVTTEAGGSIIRLSGDVARAYKLPFPGVTLSPDTMIQFDFKSDKLGSGALIGLDSDTEAGTYKTINGGRAGLSYSETNPAALFRIGGTGNISLSDRINFSGPVQPYTPYQGWKTFRLPIGSLGSGLKNYLVLACVDEDATNGTDEASFRNVVIYRGNSQSPSSVAPIAFDVDTELPKFTNGDGTDLGVTAVDMNGDGLVDLTDWRVISYNNSGFNPPYFKPNCTGTSYRNVGGTFVPDPSLTPPSDLPLNIVNHQAAGDTEKYYSKHGLLAQPMDIDGDGKLDYCVASDIRTTSGTIRNEFTFQTQINGVWTQRPEWKLPFVSANSKSSVNDGGKQRSEHFIWSDINSDGYLDLLVRNTGSGALFSSTSGALGQPIVGYGQSAVFLNRGRSGPGWIRDDSYCLPETMLWEQKDVARRLVDLDGDGIQEIAESYDSVRRTYRMDRSGPNRWNSTPGLVNPPSSSYDLPTDLRYNGTERDSARIMMDVNGDGLVDIMTSRDKSLLGLNSMDGSQTWINQGRRAASSQWKLEEMHQSAAPTSFSANSYLLALPISSSPNSGWIHYGFEQMDLNGDGLVDFVYSDLENPWIPGFDNTAVLNSGNGWTRRDAWGLPGSNRIYESAKDRESGKRKVKFLDVNGDGFPDLITNVYNQTPKVWFNQCRPEVLTSVIDGFGSSLQVAYNRLNDPTLVPGLDSRVYTKGPENLPQGQSAIIDARLVVSSYSEPDGRGGRRIRAQRYGDLRYDRSNEASLGFGWVEAKDLINNQLSRTENRRDYPFAGSPQWTRTWVDLKRAEIFTAMGNLTPGWKCLSEETASYAELPLIAGVGGIIRRPVQIGSVKSLRDLKGTVLSRTTTTQAVSDFDEYGFVKKSSVTSLDGTTVVTTSEYNHIIDSTKWFLGRLSSAKTVKSGQGKPTVTKTSAFTYAPLTGLLKTETVEPENALSVTKSYDHDDFGNVTSTSVTGSGLTRSGSSRYDPQGRFLISESNALGHTISYRYDFQKALLLSTSDIALKTTSFEYDPFGTQIRTFHIDGTQTGESTNFSNNSALPFSVSQYLTNPIVYVRAKQTSGSPVGRVYFDLLGREVCTESTILRDANASGSSRYSKIYTVCQYDSLGRKTLVSQAFGAGDNPNFTSFRYDILGRPLITQHPDGTSDQALMLDTLQIAGQPVSYSKGVNSKTGILEQWRDQHERMIQTLDPSGQITLFNYDLENRLLNVSVGDTLLLSNTFDQFGNKTSVTEANSGTSSSSYNAFGELISSTNAKNQTITYNYDVLGRPLWKITPEDRQFFLYYSSGPAIGSPWQIISRSVSDTLSYDGLGRLVTSTRSQAGQNFTSSTSYDDLGRVASTTDEGGLTIMNEYDPLYSIPVSSRIGLGSPGAGTILWKAGTFDSRGRALTQTLAQGVTASASYNPTTGHVKSTTASQSSTVLQNKAYTWDALGNLTSRTDAISGRTETFGYDTLNRVTSATVSGSGSLPVSNFVYAANGNLSSKPGATLVYQDARPHAVSSATIKGAARSYVYDADGYVTSDSKRTYTWTSFGQLASLDYLSAPALQTLAGSQIYAPARVQTNFGFDSDGNRASQFKQRIALDDSRILEETIYLGGYERETHSTRTSGTSPPVTTKTIHRHNIGGAIYTRTQLPGIAGQQVKLTTILKDHLGSTDVLYTAIWDGNAFINPTTERQSFDAWGERRDPLTLAAYRINDTDAFRTSGNDYDRGYTGHEQLDDSGLIHMNGRIYDPELGRMLSPDPFVQVPEYSQNFNRYSYVMNNPVNLTDPSGFSWFSKTFKKVTNWVKENWRTIAVIVVAAVLTLTPGGQAFVGVIAGGLFPGAVAAGGLSAFAASGAVVGGITGGLGAALNGGNLGDILRGAAVGGITGAISGSILHGMEGAAEASGLFLDKFAHMAGHGIVGGASNVALGGKFQDGFLSAAAGAYAGWTLLKNSMIASTLGSNGYGRTFIAGAVGGTASVLGGGKFANGAATSAFQHLLNNEFGKWSKTHLSARETDGAFSIDSNIYGNENDGVRSGKVQIHVGRTREQFTFDMEKRQWLNANRQKLPKFIRDALTNKPHYATKLNEAFGRLKRNGIQIPRGAGAVAFVAGVISWNGRAQGDLGAYQAAIERGAPGLIAETRQTMILNSPMTDAQHAIIYMRLQEIDGGD